jgi:hypothetical protein
MELVPAAEIDDDTTLSWSQLAWLGLCWLCCCGAGMALWRCSRILVARCHTMWLEVAPKMKVESRVDKDLPTLVKDQGSQTEQGIYAASSPKTGPLATPTKSMMLGTPRRGQQKDILLDMARRAQPVIREVEARKHWSVQNAWLESQEERC